MKFPVLWLSFHASATSLLVIVDYYVLPFINKVYIEIFPDPPSKFSNSSHPPNSVPLPAFTCDTKKCILPGGFLLFVILPLNGPKHLPLDIAMCAISPALRNSGGRWASSSVLWETLAETTFWDGTKQWRPIVFNLWRCDWCHLKLLTFKMK